MKLGYRYYDASTGRFLSRDPIRDGDNWYAYCDNDPVNAVDPTGLDGLNGKDIGRWAGGVITAIGAYTGISWSVNFYNDGEIATIEENCRKDMQEQVDNQKHKYEQDGKVPNNPEDASFEQQQALVNAQEQRVLHKAWRLAADNVMGTPGI